ncbi:hypothetical protein D7D52_36520 [Nocardia yunnanensis]|uniref:Uncharacterized protein n=1 Tax=Nocardia yunnanensis TaxID=2382165 RepID=A0A386ZPD9_9NOCA|nr:hypothetical protein [Nocardia yunnanensis]AYF78425.1 hypothetical protein D7D52_36520 [Nocardia yunnanensis]
MPDIYRAHLRSHADGGAKVGSTTGVRAVLALDTDHIDRAEQFAEVLANIRASASESDNSSGTSEFTALPNSETVRQLHANLVETGAHLADLLSTAAAAARAGQELDGGLPEAIGDWHASRHLAWERAGVPGPPPSAGAEDLRQILDRLVAEEADRERAEAERRLETETLRKKLGQLRVTIENLGTLAADDELYRAVRDKAIDDAEAIERRLTGLITADLPLHEPPEATLDSVADEDIETLSGTDDFTVSTTAADVSEVVDADESTVAPRELSATEFDEESTQQATRIPTPQPATADLPPDPVEQETARADLVGLGALHSGDPGLEEGFDVASDLAEHLRAGRYGAAWLVASAAGLPDSDVAAYRLASAAFNSGPGAVDSSGVLVQFTSAGDPEYGSFESARVALAASLRAGLTAGWMPRSEVDKIARQATLDDPTRGLVAAAVIACERNYQHLQDFGGRHGPSVEEVREQARELHQQLDQTYINFTRANKALRYLMRNQQALGSALAAVEAETNGTARRDMLTAALATLDDPDHLISAADAAMSSVVRSREPIVAHARSALIKAIDLVRDCVANALSAAATATADANVTVAAATHHDLVDAAKAVHTATAEPDGPGNVALRNLASWILDPRPPHRWPGGEQQILVTESLPVSFVDRDDDGLPANVTGMAGRVARALRNPPTPTELFDLYAERGDLQQAAAVALGDPALLERIDSERARWARKLSNESAAVRAEIGRTFADNFTEGVHTDAESRLVGPDSYVGDRFDIQMAVIEGLRADLLRHRQKTAAALRNKVAAEVADPKDRDKIFARIAADDFVGANELLSLSVNGPLPDMTLDGESNTGAHIFETFLGMLRALRIDNASSIRNVVSQLTNVSGQDNAEIRNDELSRLLNWDNLLNKKGAGQRQRQATLSSVLRALGLDMREFSSQNGSAKQYDLFRVIATPVDGSLVAGLGSRASHYLVAVTADAKLLKQTLSSAFPSGAGANIVLFAGVLSEDQRRQCLLECRAKKITAIVVDHAVAAYIAAHHPRSFKTVQQLTLPFSVFTHYTMVAGQVPDEVFVGRAEEQALLTDPAGSQFVYGGRQLGKSALLRRIERQFNGVEDQHAIYIDLSTHGIGGWSESNQLWTVLYNELASIGSVGLKPQPNVRNHEPVIKAITKWLEGKASRRLLLLLDEADAFLEKESIPGADGFKNVGPLKQLFESTAGRFKPVFAGLHKVQRLQNVANTPLAHGGRDVLIGPLGAKPAHDLVVKPLEALGYKFSNPDAVWRLLAFTNMQPGLIQVMCNDLIELLQSRPVRKTEPPILITDADIDAVTTNPTTREKVASRLGLTIQLDVRYKVIALAIAIQSMEDGFRERYAAGDIRALCELYWPEGFSDLNSAEFVVYLDELIGLGVLTKDVEKQYSVRSPNIVTMLGTRDELLAELEEAEFELATEYNPRSTRRRLKIGGRTVRSPLSEHDLSELVPRRDRHSPANIVIIGSEALGIATVAPILQAVGADRYVAVTVLDGEDRDLRQKLDSFRFSPGGGGKKATLLLIDAVHVEAQRAAQIAESVLSLRKRTQGHLIINYGTSGIEAVKSLIARPSSTPATIVKLKKWSGDGIRSWHDNPFSSPAERRDLLIRSGGWPELVEKAVADVDRGISPSEEWDKLSAFPSSPSKAAEFLDRVGVAEPIRGMMTEWAGYDLDYETAADIAAVLERDPDRVQAVLAELEMFGIVDEHDDQYRLDPVVARALGVLHG